ncbi:unnamed protein product [Arctia plantaginis]|uniref:Uncharacterized protein n=1 Tax=Arctia plantaginis TaxID=874455 RepID=A0A8S0ZHF8_ARCPL|nr:unnamed protein product [Arctia plantaginis]
MRYCCCYCNCTALKGDPMVSLDITLAQTIALTEKSPPKPGGQSLFFRLKTKAMRMISSAFCPPKSKITSYQL